VAVKRGAQAAQDVIVFRPFPPRTTIGEEVRVGGAGLILVLTEKLKYAS